MNARAAHGPDLATSPAAQAHEADLQEAVDQALVSMAYDRLRLGVAWTVGVFVFFSVLYWPFFPSEAKGLWVFMVLTVSALRFVLWRAYQRADAATRTQRKWRTLFLVGAIAAGLAWSFGLVMLMPAAGQVESMLLVLAAVHVSAVATSALGSQLKAMLGFQLCILIPMAAALVATGGVVERLAGVVIAVGTVALMVVGRASVSATRAVIEAELRLSRSLDETRAARARAEAASLAKSRFLANMSHELRSPLNAVIGAAQLLRAESRAPQQQEELIGAIQGSGANLLGLIDNILDISRIEAGEFVFHRKDFDLIACVDAAMATAGLAARGKGLQLACIIDPALPVWRHGDPDAVRQVLLNLLGNAVKFTPLGDITVRLQAADTPGVVSVTVSDTGVGIPPQALPHIFEPFRQGDDRAVRRFGGSGLGLAIVRQLVDAMEGRISVDSTPGKGAQFHLRLPLPLAQEPAPDAPGVPGAAQRRLRVAYVEPHQPSAEALDALLVRMGFAATRCDDAQSLQAWCRASEAAADDSWLLICTDTAQSGALMPVARQLLPEDRVIGMSGTESRAAASSDMPTALTRNVIKPVSRAALASRLVRSALPAERAGTVAAVPDHGAGNGTLSRKQVLVVEDDAVNRVIVRRMLEHAGCLVTLAPDGQSGLAALRERPFDLVLMDWQMPDMDGLEVTRQIRAGAAGKPAADVPIVALTANAFAEDRDACLRAGMNDFLSKPVLATSLVAAIERHARRPGGANPASVPLRGQVHPPVLDPSVLAGQHGDTDGAQPGCTDTRLRQFADGGSPLLAAITEAQERNDLSALQHAIQSLRSAAAAVGAMALAQGADLAEAGLRAGRVPTEDDVRQLQRALDTLKTEIRRNDADVPLSGTAP